jgi:hypothetical protein
MYLVIARALYDDLPLALFTSWGDAVEYAKQWESEDADTEAAERLMFAEGCEVSSLMIVAFAEGRPISSTTVQFDNEVNSDDKLKQSRIDALEKLVESTEDTLVRIETSLVDFEY